MTSVRCSRSILLCNFYSHAPYGTWPNVPSSLTDFTRFLLTRPLRDVTHIHLWMGWRWWISTHTPLTGRDSFFFTLLLLFIISTHTPLTGRDALSVPAKEPLYDFYSHAPYGTWRYNRVSRDTAIGFLLTRHLRDVTHLLCRIIRLSEISTHTPLTGRDKTDWER